MSFILPWRRKKIENQIIGFKGRYYNKNPAINWSPYIPIFDKPIVYLEIGCADGGNVVHIAKSYCKHPDSKIVCVDPWMDYDDYPEYKGEQDIAWNTFNENMKTFGLEDKLVIKRGFSEDIVPTLEDESFDLIFVDGNHETDYVYKDGVMSLQKVKKGGYIVFDDYVYTWSQTMRGIDTFIEDHKDSIEVVLKSNTFFQVIVRKL
jgi:hypothetical protein